VSSPRNHSRREASDYCLARVTLNFPGETHTNFLAYLCDNLFRVMTLALNDRNHTRSFMSLEIGRPRATEAPIVVATARYVLLPVANLLTGYSVKAMERKIERGDWQEGKVWKRAPDGRIVIDVLGYQRWIEGPKAAVQRENVERLKAELPVQMDLGLRREKGTQGDGNAKA
jgi:hypothetical protein